MTKARQQMADVLDKLQKLRNEGYAPHDAVRRLALVPYGTTTAVIRSLHERFESERQRSGRTRH